MYSRKTGHNATSCRRLATTALSLMLATGPAVAAAQEPQTVSRQTGSQSPADDFRIGRLFMAPEIGLAEAVALTLRYSPEVQRRRQEVARALGSLTTNRGAFDALLQVTPSYSYDYKELAPALRARERDNRNLIEALRDVGNDITNNLNTSIDNLESSRSTGRPGDSPIVSATPRCPDSLGFDPKFGVFYSLPDGRRIFLQALSAGSSPISALTSSRPSPSSAPARAA